MYFAKNKLFDRQAFQSELEDGAPRVALFRDTLRDARGRLRQFHEQGASSQDVVNHHAWLVDQILHFAWECHLPLLQVHQDVALVAVGGYGRGELHPASDVDLMMLTQHSRHERVRDFVESLLSFLWDIGLEVGHSVRSIKDCVREAKQDITVATNIMEARLLEGDPRLLKAMREKTGAGKIWPADKFFAAKLKEQRTRHGKFDDTAYNLEPNVKDGPGGLRDIHTVIWVMQRRYGITDIKELINIGFLTEEEYRHLIRGRNLLWKLRNGLHFIAGRREDRLLFDHQRTLARQFGYTDGEHHLAVEQLMKRYYRTVKELRLLSEILVQNYEEQNSRSRSVSVKPINRRFQSYNGFLETVNERIFQRYPFAILELFLVLQQHRDIKGVRADTIRLVRANLHRIDQRFRDDIRCRSLFTEFMRQPTGITHGLRRMNAYGVLGAYIPVFGRVVGQMQHDLFHVYTVDAHSLFVVRNLRRFAVPKYRSEFPLASRIMAELVKPERLYLAGLFHDIAKGRGGDHSVLGEQDAMNFCHDHDLSDYDAHFVSWLVRHHLLMSFIAQRRDISDSEVVEWFADQVGDQEHLNNLYLLTIADIRGTSPHVWNAWKGRLLEELYVSTSRVLRRGHGEPIRIEDRIGDVKSEVLANIADKRLSPQLVEEYWSALADDYFLRHDAHNIAWHIKEIAAASAIDLPLVAIRHDPRLEANVFLIYAPEGDDLLNAVTGGFERMKLNIVDARLHTTSSGFALYTFVALEENVSDSDDPEYLASLKQRLRAQIRDPSQIQRPRPIQLSRTMKHFPIQTRVTFSDSGGATHTVMEVVAQDQPGLLHRVAGCLLQCKVRLVTAKIATLGERAEDVFFITDRDGEAVSDTRQLDCLKSRIEEALAVTREPAAPQAAHS